MNLNSTAIAGCLNYFRQGPPPFIRVRNSLSPTPNYKIICATFSFKGDKDCRLDVFPSPTIIIKGLRLYIAKEEGLARYTAEAQKGNFLAV